MIKAHIFASAAVLITALSACTTGAPTNQDGIDRALAAGAPQAFCPDFPEALFLAHEEVCSRPGETVVRPNDREIRCEMLLPPEMTGGLILQFGGTVEDLPKLVIAFVAQSARSGGWVVTSDNYVRVPQRDGGIREVRLPNSDLQASTEELFRRSGGRPL